MSLKNTNQNDLKSVEKSNTNKLATDKKTLIEVDKLIKDFNTNIRKLFMRLEQVDKNDVDLINIRTRINIPLRDMLTTFVLEKMGPVLYIYREYIIDKKIEFFLDLDVSKFEEDLGKNSMDIIKKLKSLWPKRTEAERNEFYKIFLELTITYLEYKNKWFQLHPELIDRDIEYETKMKITKKIDSDKK